MKKMLIAVLTLLLTATLLTTTATAQEKITGPWLWMITSTEPGLGGAASIDSDSLAVASGGAVTEAAIAANGARAGDRVGNYVWTFGEISATGWDNINECLNRIGMTNGNVDDHSSYALFQFQADTAQRGVTMHVGSDDAIKVWLNGTVVHNHPVNRGASDFQDTFPVNVVAGENLLLVKVSERGGGWSMFVGMDTADAPVRGPDAPVRGPVEVMSIPDANLAAAIRETLGLPTDAVITADAMLDLTWLEAPGKGITDLTGLEYATNLRVLVLHAARIDSEFLTNPISDISPLSALSQLEGLAIGNTPVSDISSLSALSQLKTLYLDYTDVSDISPLSALSQLTRLGLIDTAVSDISPLSALSQLTWLSLDGTAVSDISPLSALTQLVELNLSGCPLNADAYQTHIPTIQANGTEVTFSPFKPIHLQEVPWLVSLIYFRPSDRPGRPNVDAEIDALIKKAQRFFADQLEHHGFGRKTFQFETDAHGNAVVHHVTGKFPNAHYQQNYDSWKDEIGEQIYIPRRSITAYMLDSDPDGRSFTEFGGYGGGSPYSGGSAAIDSQLWDWVTIAHELGHAFGMNYHDHRDLSLMSYQGFDGSLSPCFAAWLDVHPAFNPTVVRIGTRATIQMLPATLAAPPNAIRLRFTVTAPAGSLYQARLLTPEKNVRMGYAFNSGGLIDCKRIDGNPTSNTVEFVTALTPDTERISLQIIGIDGDSIDSESFPIDVASLLPPAKVVSIPDPNLAAAVRESLNIPSGEPITTHSILNLVKLEARNRGIKSLTGLAHAVNLKEVDLGGEYISGEGNVNSNAISDVSPLAALTQLTWLSLWGTGVSDVSPLANLTQLTLLALWGTGVSDVSPLANLTQLTSLSLGDTAVSDVSPLANLTQLTRLALYGTAVSDVSPLAALTQLTSLSLWGTGVSDVSPLAALTQLTSLSLGDTAVSDVSPLANLTQLTDLALWSTAVSDVSPLANLTQLTWLYLHDTGVSDVSPLANLTQLEELWLTGCPLSYASLHTHIPALQAKGTEVEFDNVAHPALLKTSGDSQEGAPGATLKTPFVVEAMDAHGKPLVGVPIQFEIRHGGGTLNANTVKTDARGKAQITLTLGRASGINKVKASSEGIQSYVLFTAAATGAAPQLAADVNSDGVVDLADLAIVAQAMGKPVKNPSADVNGDGVVDGEDFALVAANLGEGEAAAPSQAPLPAGLTLEKVEWALNLLHAENTGSPAFRRGIAKLEGFLALLIPDKTLLLANYPNPFNPETWIPYQLANPAEVTVTIYAANGAVVRTLDLGHQRAGSYASRSRAAYWDGRNAQGEPVASGVYFYTLTAGDFSATRKMLILK